MTRRVLQIVAFVCAPLVTQICAPLPASFAASFAATSVNVIGDDGNDAYVGTGGLLLPSTFSGSGATKRRVATCMGCVWKYSTYCASDSVDMCAHAVSTCPPRQVRYRVWFGLTRETVQVIGSVCWGWHTPATRKQIEDRLDDLVVRVVPTLNVHCEPPGDTLTSIPVICYTSQPAMFKPPGFTLATHTVRITASAKWRWSWGNDAVEWRSVPGRPYPSTQISHRFRFPGDYVVHVTTVWSASYIVSGLGNFTVGGDVITQNAQTDVAVHSAKSLRTLSK